MSGPAAGSRVLCRAVAVVATLLAALATAGCGLLPGSAMHIRAQFPDAVGLYVGNDVSVLGLKVGSVTAIRPLGTRVEVDLEIDPEVKIPADAAAVTLSPSVVTDRRVELTPVYRGGPTMRDGDLIPVDRTRTPVEIDRVFAAADRLANALNSAVERGGRPALAGAVEVAADTFAGNGDKLRASVRGLAAAVGVGADNRDQLVSLIKTVDHLTETTADHDALVRAFSHDLTEATALFDQQGPNLVRTLDNLTELIARADRLIRENREVGRHTLANLRVTADTLADRTRELAESADVLPMTFRNLADIVDFGRGRARVHASFQEALLNNQLFGDLCRRYGPPRFCSGTGGTSANTGLALLLLGGAR